MSAKFARIGFVAVAAFLAACSSADDSQSESGAGAFTGSPSELVGTTQLERISEAYTSDNDPTHLRALGAPDYWNRRVSADSKLSKFTWQAQLQNPAESVLFKIVEETDPRTGKSELWFFHPAAESPAASARCKLDGAVQTCGDWQVGMPLNIGECVETTIWEKGGRLGGDDYDVGTYVTFANRGMQVSYEREEGIIRSSIGDPVQVCLTSIPQGCPAGDARGRTYTTTNKRTNQSWSMGDSSHMCGGA